MIPGIVASGLIGLPSPPAIGSAYGGGYYFGRIQQDDGIYNLVVSPKSTGEITKAFKTTDTSDSGADSLYDGLANSNVLNNASHPAAQWCRSRVIATFSDWYLPSRDEIELLYRNLKPTSAANSITTRNSFAGGGPMGENLNSIPQGAAYTTSDPAVCSVALFAGGAQALAAATYYTSNDSIPAGVNAITQHGTSGYQNLGSKTTVNYIRAIRRVKVS